MVVQDPNKPKNFDKYTYSNGAVSGPEPVEALVFGNNELTGRWLASMYDRLSEAVRANRAKLVIVIFPLAYQLDPNYPFLPQERIVEYCQQKSVPCLDLLPAFRQHRKEDIFVLDKEGHDDIWHLTDDGHRLTAGEGLRFLRKEELLSLEKK